MNIAVFVLFLFFCSLTFAEKNFRIPEVIQFADNLSQKFKYEKSEVLDALSVANYRQIVIDNISKPAEKILSWGEYRGIFLIELGWKTGKYSWRTTCPT